MNATTNIFKSTLITAATLAAGLALAGPASAQTGAPGEFDALALRECAPYFKRAGQQRLCVAVVIRVLQNPTTVNPREACYEARFRPRRRPGQRSSDLSRCSRVATAARSRVYGATPVPPPAPPPEADPIPAP